MHVSIITAPSDQGLGDRLSADLDSRWHSDFTIPRIYTLAAADRALVATAARRISRVSAQHGIFAPTIDLGTQPAMLDAACTHRVGVTDLPLEPSVPASDLLFALGLWTRLAARKQRLLMRFSPDIDLDIVVNAERANPMLCVQVGRWHAVRFAVISPDLVAGEVVGRALRAAAVDADWDGVSPWQHPLVQHAIERRLGVRTPDEFTIKRIGDDGEQSGGMSMAEVIRRSAQLIDVALDAPPTSGPDQASQSR